MLSKHHATRFGAAVFVRRGVGGGLLAEVHGVGLLLVGDVFQVNIVINIVKLLPIWLIKL
jgi:hypothetical protein